MRLIPVIDIKNGLVVHAQRGQRAHYLPIKSLLCANADINSVIHAFLQIDDFKIFYLADLNAITQQGDNYQLIAQVLHAYPKQTFWIDAGYQSSDLFFTGLTNYRPVLGSECCAAEQIVAKQKTALLSLDFSANDEPLGDACLFNDASLWSKQVIIMTLARVGSDLGPDIEKLKKYQQAYPDIEFIASGGIRNKTDLQALQTIGIHSALIASALHNKTIGQSELSELNAKKYPD